MLTSTRSPFSRVGSIEPTGCRRPGRGTSSRPARPPGRRRHRDPLDGRAGAAGAARRRPAVVARRRRRTVLASTAIGGAGARPSAAPSAVEVVARRGRSESVTAGSTVAVEDAARWRAARRRASDGGASTTVACGPRPTSSRSNHASAATARRTRSVPSARVLDVLDRVGLGDPRRRGRRGRASTRGIVVVGLEHPGRRGVAGGSKRSSRSVAAGDAVDAEAALGRRPGGSARARRGCRPRRGRGRGRRRARCARRARRSSSRGGRGGARRPRCGARRAPRRRRAPRSTSSTWSASTPRTAASLATPRPSAPSSSRAGQREHRRPGGEQRDGLVGREALRRVEHVGEVDPDAVALLHDVDERVGRVGREADEPHHLEVGGQLLRGEPEALAHLGEGGAVVRGDPRHHREEALHARRPSRRRRVTTATRPGRRGARAARAPRRARGTTARRSGRRRGW